MSDDFGLFNAKKKNNYGLAFGIRQCGDYHLGAPWSDSPPGNRNEDLPEYQKWSSSTIEPRSWNANSDEQTKFDLQISLVLFGCLNNPLAYVFE